MLNRTPNKDPARTTKKPRVEAMHFVWEMRDY